MLRWRTGAAGSSSSAINMARHLTHETLTAPAREMARYFAAERVPSAELDLADAAKSGVEVRRDIDPQLAERLGITGPYLTESELANLLAGLTATAAPIEGKQVQKPQRSVADTFGLAEFGKSRVALPDAAGVHNILEGRRADGGEVKRRQKDEKRHQAQIDGARKRFLIAYGVKGREPTEAEVENMKAGRLASGLKINHAVWSRDITATKAPIAYIDMIYSAPKHLSVAWALAPTEAERGILLQAHFTAVDETMRYAEQTLGFAAKGKQGRDGVERGSIAWARIDHFTARPVAELVASKRGEHYTEFQEIKLAGADPSIHSHCPLINVVMTKDGRITSIDLDRLDGRTKELGAVYQAIVARELGRSGVETALDPRTGACRLIGVPEYVVEHFSKRTRDATNAAKELAKREGLDWDSLAPERQIAMLRAGAEISRHRKARTDGVSDFDLWFKQALDQLQYQHRSLLRPDETRPDLAPKERHMLAYKASLNLIEEAFARRSKLDASDMREFAVRGFIAVGGIGADPGADIAAATKLYRDHGVRQDGKLVRLLWGQDVPLRGKERVSVTTDLHVQQEERAIELMQEAAKDRTRALSSKELDHAEVAFLARRPDIDPNDPQWQKQRAVMRALGEGGAFGVAIGAAGCGKTTLIGGVVEGWKEHGGAIYGLSVAWKAAGNLAETGIARENLLAIAKFVKLAHYDEIDPLRNGKKRLDLGPQTVVVVDEVGTLGKRQLLELLELRHRHGFQIKCIGDPKQTAAIEAGNVVALMERALGKDAIPEIITSVRQKTEREREIAGLFREGHAAIALGMKREDGSAELVAGGREKTIKRVADLWRARTEANRDDPQYELTISAPTNIAAKDIGLAVRAHRRDMGLIGEDKVTIRAVDRVERQGYDLMLAIGDKVRVYDRIYAERWKSFASNGDFLEIRAVSDRGMLARNERGQEHWVAWNKLHDKDTGLPCLNYGYATTIHAAQGITSTEHINAVVDGSRAVNSFLNYPAESRQTVVTFTVINEAAERKEVAWRQPMGAKREILLEDVWNNVARNLSQQPEKALAIDFARRESVRRGDIRKMQAQVERTQRRELSPPVSRALHHAKNAMELSLAVDRSMNRGLRAMVRSLTAELGRPLTLDRGGWELRGRSPGITL